MITFLFCSSGKSFAIGILFLHWTTSIRLDLKLISIKRGWKSFWSDKNFNPQSGEVCRINFSFLLLLNFADIFLIVLMSLLAKGGKSCRVDDGNLCRMEFPLFNIIAMSCKMQNEKTAKSFNENKLQSALECYTGYSNSTGWLQIEHFHHGMQREEELIATENNYYTKMQTYRRDEDSFLSHGRRYTNSNMFSPFVEFFHSHFSRFHFYCANSLIYRAEKLTNKSWCGGTRRRWRVGFSLLFY